MAMSFEWPWQYRFPPFFTLQPNVDTRQKQLAAWCSLVLSFCRLHKQSSMTVMEAQESPLFNNVKLQRKLPVESIQIVLEELRKKGNLEWLDKSKSSFLIMWRRPEEWGKLIYQWVRSSCCQVFKSDPWQRILDTWCPQIQTEQNGKGAERGSVGLPGKPLSVTQCLWLCRTSLSLPVGGQGLCEAIFGECRTGNPECYCWLEPLATGDKWGKEGKKPGAPPPLHPYGTVHNMNEIF
uniref:Vacuolar protein-sorting-associated protein 25 n=2 Tax=Catarrhini TaxID=9526 RepID=A0A5F7ZB52_MACMU